MTESSAGGQAASTGKFTHRQIMLVLSGLLLGMFLAALDQTIVSTAMRTIADDLNGLTLQAWATTAYLITATISTPLYGKLSDIYGRKALYLIAISIFLVGSLISALSTSMYMLAVARAVQGLGAGGLMSLALAIVADMVSPRERSKYQGYFMSVFGVSSVLGPVVGGFFSGMHEFAGLTGWRWVFMINVPIGLAALVVVGRELNLPRRSVPAKIDYWGAATLIVALVPLLIVAEQGRTWGWADSKSIAMYVIGGAGVIAFILAEFMMKEAALLPMHFFKNKAFAMAIVLNTFVGIGMFGAMVCLPLYLQIVRGQSPTASGLMLLPLTAGIIAASTISGKLIAGNGRYKVYPIMGTALMGLSLLGFSTIQTNTNLIWFGFLTLSMGVGLGLSFQTLVLAVQNEAPAGETGVATSSATFFRSIGGTAGTAVFLSVLFGVVGDRIASAFKSASSTQAFQAAMANPANQQVVNGLQGGNSDQLNNTSFLSHIDQAIAAPIKDGFSSAIGTVFLVGAAVMVVAFALSFLLKETPLSDKSGLEHSAQADLGAEAWA